MTWTINFSKNSNSKCLILMGLSDYIKKINFKLWPQLFIMEHSLRCLKYFEISYAQCQYSKEHRFSKIVVFINIILLLHT